MNLNQHPFAVEAFFKHSIVLTFALPKADLPPLLPPCLKLDTYNDQWAFVAMALVHTTQLRPKGFPAFLGNDFTLIGYRIFVRYVNNEGKRLRGLYILKSETNSKKMEYLGNIFTKYRYTTTDITEKENKGIHTIFSKKSNFSIVLDKQKNENIALPSHSPFQDWKEARRFAGPLPFTFSFDAEKKEVLIIEGVRGNWTPQPIKILEYNINFLQEMGFENAILANAFQIENIPYYWKKGKIETWKKIE